MGKATDIDQLTNLMSRALRHKIGSIVNENEIYAAKYAKDAENIMKCQKLSISLGLVAESQRQFRFWKVSEHAQEPPRWMGCYDGWFLTEAEKIINRQNWNNYDKGKINEKLRKKLEKELTEKDFLNDRKFEIMDEEIGKALSDFNLKP